MKKSNSANEEGQGRIAIVEELADNIYSIKFILQSLGYPVQSYSTAAGSLEKLLEDAPKLVIVDMLIPGGGGFDVIRWLRQGPLRKVSILAITAEAMEGGSEEDARKGGATDTLNKPYTVPDLQEKVDKLVTRA